MSDEQVEIIFNAPAHHFLETDGQRIGGGRTGFVSAERAAELAAAGVGVELVAPSPDELQRQKTRDELDELARAAGVTDPDALPNKAAVAAAIAEAEASAQEPEAEGEGPDTDSKQED